MKYRTRITAAPTSAQLRKLCTAVALAVGSLTLMPAAQAQTATVEGVLNAFDVINQSGQFTHGFEIQIEGASQADLYYTMGGQRYGAAKVTPYATGVRIRWSASYDAATGKYSAQTPQYIPGTPFSWNDCYAAGQRYTISGCEHFGQSMRSTQNIVHVTGRWLVDDPANPGTLIPLEPNVAIPYGNWFVAPPTVVSAPPVVVAEVEAPEPPEAPELHGDAQWVKIYKTQLTRSLTVDELSSDNPTVVPLDPTQIEVSWDILQADPTATNSNGNQKRARNRQQGSIQPDTRSVIRRIETYKFTGAYDPVDHAAICADLNLCAAPSAGELGDLIGATNTAANVQADSLVINKTGNGNVDSSDKIISCGSKCASPYTRGTSVTVTAKAASGSVFSSWSGACTGVLTASCTVNVTGLVNAIANFTTTTATGGGGGGGGGGGTTTGGGGGGTATSYQLKVSASNSGTITSDTGGINCGTVCQASYAPGSLVTLTATPPAGKTFAGWSGSCTGTNATCTVTMNATLSVKANFNK